MNHHWKALVRRRGKDAFILSLKRNDRVLDVGCGNDSPRRVKSLNPNLYYIGLDVQDYEQSNGSTSLANEYRVTTPEKFLSAIQQEKQSIDAVLSAHNLEHCAERYSVLRAICGTLKTGGNLYLSFPSEASVAMPSRRGTLCYHDDITHIDAPPCWQQVLDELTSSGMTIEFSAKRYRPLIPFAIGLLLEPWSALNRRVAPLGSTWALYGFESVIWAKKKG